ncbi:unnamed protein product, partial [Urochloa humidicola]
TSAPTGGPNSIPPHADRRRQREWRERRTGGERGRLPGGAPAAGPSVPLPERRSSAAAGVERGPAPMRPSVARHAPGRGPTLSAAERAPIRAGLPPLPRARTHRRLTRERERETATATTLAAAGDLRSSAVEARACELEREAGTAGVGWSSAAGIAAASSTQARRPRRPRAHRRVHRPPPVPPGLSSSAISHLPTLRRASAGRRARPPGRGPSPSRSKPAPPSICWGRRRDRSGRGPAGNQRA